MSRRKILRLQVLVLGVAGLLAASGRSASAALAQPGDIVFAVNINNAATTVELVRGGATLNGGVKQTSPWVATPWLQSIEYDNYGGIAHNYRGNLLALDFGNATNGGLIYSIPTNGPEPLVAGTVIGNTKASPENIGHTGAFSSPSRLAGLSVSPDNTKIALAAYDLGAVLVYDYTAGNTMGTGASLSGGRQAPDFSMASGATGATTWLDNDTILAFDVDGKLLEVTPGVAGISNPEVNQVATINFTKVGSNGAWLAYNPAISPYVYAGYSGFVSATMTTTNKLFVVDPRSSYSLVKEIDLSTSSMTMREMALDKDGNLFIGGAGQTISFIPGANVLNPATLTDNSSIAWYDSAATGNFNGMDIGFGTAEFEEADFNEDAFVNTTDFGIWNNGFGTASGANKAAGDADGNGAVNGADFLIWQQQFGSGGSGAAAIPEPGALALLVLGAVGFAIRCRRDVA